MKHWTQTATLLAPSNDASIAWPSTPLVMRWSAVPHAYEYLVQIATDREFANVVVGSAKSLVKTTGTAYALNTTLPAGRYYWRVTPVDNEEHRGVPSESRSFAWFWPTGTTTSVANVNRTAETFEPEFTWGPVPGAAHYEVQVNSAQQFPAGSMWCCQKEPLTVGTSLTPTTVLPNNNLYYWRVRALDVNGNAGEWNEGETFQEVLRRSHPERARPHHDHPGRQRDRAVGRGRTDRNGYADRDLVSGTGRGDLRSSGRPVRWRRATG